MGIFDAFPMQGIGIDLLLSLLHILHYVTVYAWNFSFDSVLNFLVYTSSQGPSLLHKCLSNCSGLQVIM